MEQNKNTCFSFAFYKTFSCLNKKSLKTLSSITACKPIQVVVILLMVNESKFKNS